MLDWDSVADALESAEAIAFDTCHKIYILMDKEQVEVMRGYEYDPLITKEEMGANVMLLTVQEWYRTSCNLKFVQSVATNHADPNEGFEDLIPQGASDPDDEDDFYS